MHDLIVSVVPNICTFVHRHGLSSEALKTVNHCVNLCTIILQLFNNLASNILMSNCWFPRCSLQEGNILYWNHIHRMLWHINFAPNITKCFMFQYQLVVINTKTWLNNKSSRGRINICHSRGSNPSPINYMPSVLTTNLGEKDDNHHPHPPPPPTYPLDYWKMHITNHAYTNLSFLKNIFTCFTNNLSGLKGIALISFKYVVLPVHIDAAIFLSNCENVIGLFNSECFFSSGTLIPGLVNWQNAPCKSICPAS